MNAPAMDNTAAAKLVAGAATVGATGGWLARMLHGRILKRGVRKVALSDEPETVEFRTRMALVSEQQGQLLERLVEMQDKQHEALTVHTNALTKLADTILAHQASLVPAVTASLETHQLLKEFIREAKWTPRRRRA